MQLPKKEEEVKRCPLLPNQRELYNSLLRKFSQEVEGVPGGGIAMFMQLRKAANHPLLLRNHYDDRRLLHMANALAKVTHASYHIHSLLHTCFLSHTLLITHTSYYQIHFYTFLNIHTSSHTCFLSYHFSSHTCMHTRSHAFTHSHTHTLFITHCSDEIHISSTQHAHLSKHFQALCFLSQPFSHFLFHTLLIWHGTSYQRRLWIFLFIALVVWGFNRQSTAVVTSHCRQAVLWSKCSYWPECMIVTYAMGLGAGTNQTVSLLLVWHVLVQEPSHRDRGALPKLIMEDMAQMNDFDLISLCKQYKVSSVQNH